MFGIIMTVILVGYVLYYGYNVIHDLFFDKSGEVVEGIRIEESEVDIQDTLKDFKKFSASEDLPQNSRSGNSSQDNDSDEYSVEMSGGMEVGSFVQGVNAADETGNDELFEELIIAVKAAA